MEIGEKIKNLRLAKGLTQKELADRCELSKSFISLLERDLTSPSIATLVDLLDILGTSLEKFFQDKGPEQIVFSKKDISIKESEEEGTSISWLVYNAQKNDMEPILVTIEPGATLFDEEPHEGEEYGYILQGTLSLYINEGKHKARKGESFYYKADCSHRLVNESTKKVVALMVSTPPSF